MGVLSKYDTERLALDVKTILVDEFNDKIDEITTDKAKEAVNLVLSPVMRRLGDVTDTGTTDVGNAINMLGTTKKSFIYDPYIVIEIPSIDSISSLGEIVDEINIFISMIDPHNGDSEIRLFRYLRALTEIFTVDKSVGIVSVSQIDRLGYLSTPDYLKKETRRIAWGIGLRFIR